MLWASAATCSLRSATVCASSAPAFIASQASKNAWNMVRRRSAPSMAALICASFMA